MQEEKISLPQMSKLGKSWLDSYYLLSTKPVIFFPFAIITLLEIAGIILIFIIIQPPYVKIIAPPLLRFFRPEYLHYPFNLVLLAQLSYYLQLFIAVIVGTFMTGMTISLVDQFYQTNNFSFKQAIKQSFLKYMSLIIITIIIFVAIQYVYTMEKKVLYKIIQKGPIFMKLRREDWLMIFGVVGLFLAGFVQSLFIFAQPIVMVDNKNFLLALFRNFISVFRNLFAVLVIVLTPLLFYIPITLLKIDLVGLINRTLPEVVWVILIGSIVISLFINVFVTLSTTRLYLLIKEER